MVASVLQLNSIELKNFKSFKGLHKIGPFCDFTAVIGPNGSGKSNLIDAIAFTLCLPLLPAKHVHTRELVYRSEDSANDQEMYVQLNLNSCTLKRCYRDGVHEYSYIQNGHAERPMTASEYKTQCKSLGLEIAEFCHYQDRLLNQFQKQRRALLNETFEYLSGSIEFKEHYDELQNKINQKEAQMREISDKLREKRHEKIRMKGLSDYQKEIEKCSQEQVQASQIVTALQIFSLNQQIEQLRSDEARLAQAVDQNYEVSNQNLQQVKRLEGDIRILDNRLAENQQSNKNLRNELMELQTNAYQSEKSSENAKLLLQQKRSLLMQIISEQEQFLGKKSLCEKNLQQANEDLQALLEKINQSPQLAEEQAVREKYLEIKSKVQSTNAQIERETCKLDSQINQLQLKQAAALKEVRDMEQRMGIDDTKLQLPNQIKSTDQAITQKNDQIIILKKEISNIKAQSQTKQTQLQSVEKQLLEFSFELSEIESEKSVKTQDLKVQQALKELKSRCRGYQGQFFELVKPINSRYDIAVKVSLQKCLRMLVVDTPESATVCSDFLKEKQIGMDVLVLSNVPDRQFSAGINAKIQGANGASLVYEVIEVPRSEQQLEKAVRYFVGDKIVVVDFKQAAELQKRGVKEIVTEDGTLFSHGMISGGSHQNIFKLQLGTSQIDKQQMKLIEAIQRLENEHFSLKQSLNDDFQTKESSFQRDLQCCELELEQLRAKKQLLDRQFQAQVSSTKSLQVQLTDKRNLHSTITQQIDKLREQKVELSSEISQIELVEFKQFCKDIGVKHIKDYEDKIFGRVVGDQSCHSMLQQKAELEHKITKCNTEIQFATTQESSQQKQIDSLKQQIVEEESKIRSQANVQVTQIKAAKMQEQLKEIEEQFQTLNKERGILYLKQTKQKQDLDVLNLRDEALRKDKNTTLIKLQRLQHSLTDQLEQSRINRILDQIDPNTSDSTLIENVDTWLKSKLEDLSDPQQSIANLQQKIKDLEKMEEQFNQYVAVIPESDETAIQLTAEIQSLKEGLEKESSLTTQIKNQFIQVKSERAGRFVKFFQEVSQVMPQIYRDFTGGVGTSSLLIADTVDIPFESQIVIDFCPPGKRHGTDIESLSGGEKSIAALAFVFALAAIKRPPIVVLDEVDAFLDGDNVVFVTKFLQSRQVPSQVLIVSHKEDLASHSNSLIGVCMSKEEATSKSFSLDLQQFD